MKKLVFLMVLLVMTLFSCRKMDIDPINNNPVPTTELQASSSFDWKTSKDITLNIIGMKDINPNISNILYVKSSNGDTIYYNDLLVMINNYTIKFAVPTTETNVIVIYGSKTQMIDLLSNTITFDYILQ